MKILLISTIFLYPSIGNCYEDVNVFVNKANKERTILQVDCNNNVYKLDVKITEITSEKVNEWFDMIIATKCRGEKQ